MQQHLMQMQQQQQQPMMAAAYYPNTVTSDHIQQYLDENKALILKIIESQNSGKINECAENQARLQRNLMYLAAIADAQSQPSAMHSQYSTSSAMQQTGGHYMQHQQAQAMNSQALMAARSSMLYSQQPYVALQQHQALSSNMGMSSMGDPSNGAYSDFARATVSKQENGGEDRGDGSENLYMKTSDD